MLPRACLYFFKSTGSAPLILRDVARANLGSSSRIGGLVPAIIPTLKPIATRKRDKHHAIGEKDPRLVCAIKYDNCQRILEHSKVLLARCPRLDRSINLHAFHRAFRDAAEPPLRDAAWFTGNYVLLSALNKHQLRSFRIKRNVSAICVSQFVHVSRRVRYRIESIEA